jgi:hypothetical protein
VLRGPLSAALIQVQGESTFMRSRDKSESTEHHLQPVVPVETFIEVIGHILICISFCEVNIAEFYV